MTDEQVAELLCEAYDRAKPVWWITGTDDKPETREASRVAERWLSVVRLTREQLEANKREQTAATILAALIQAHAADQGSGYEVSIPYSYAKVAVSWADELRDELAKVKP